MKKKNVMLALMAFGLFFTSCTDDNDDDNKISTKDLTLNVTGLENLGADFVYEGWIIVNGNHVSTGRFTVNDEGNLSKTSFTLKKDTLDLASKFVLTIEPANGDEAEPTNVHILGGDFSGSSSQLSIGHDTALGNDFTSAAGKYTLGTPTNGADSDENSGIWFLDMSSGSPVAGLILPDLPAGWKYEGWIVTDGKPITSGKFTSATGVDEFNEFSEGDGPPFPGEDYLINPPNDLTFPIDLAGGKAVISIEPDPDNSPNPFLLKPLAGDIPADATGQTTYDLEQNLTFPTGTASR
ncbi:MAG: anti-sigma factor [Flavobacteriaceae bacterium]|nr:anti-sigma factor [Flavobacteriaceae bacterium]